MCSSINHKRGFTLIELLWVLAIATLISSIGFPSLNRLITRYAVISASNNLYASINYARTEAIMRSTRVGITPEQSDNWSTGWIVFIDRNANGLLDQNERVLTRYTALSQRVSLQFNLEAYLSFTKEGYSKSIKSGAPRYGTFIFDGQSGEHRCIIIASTSRPIISTHKKCEKEPLLDFLHNITTPSNV